MYARECSRDVLIEFELKSSNDFHFWTNTRMKGMNPLIPQLRVS